MPDPTGSASTSTVVVDDEKTFDAAYVKKLNDENAKRRIENKELKTELAGLKEQVTALGDIDARLKLAAGVKPDDDTTDPVKAMEERLAALETDSKASADAAKKAEAGRRETLIRTEIKTQAMAMGLADGVDSADVLALIDRAEIKYDEKTDTVEGVDKALDALKESKAYLFNAENARALRGTPGPGNIRTRRDSGEETMSDKIIKYGNERNPLAVKPPPTGDLYAPADPQRKQK